MTWRDAVSLDAVDQADSGSSPAPPRWLQRVGPVAWVLLVCLALLVAATWILAKMSTIVAPTVVAVIAAAVTSPLVTSLHRRRVPRAAGAALVLLALIALGVVILLLVVGGITSQSDDIATSASSAVQKIEGWLKDAGVDSSGAESVRSSLVSAVPAAIATLTKGVASGISGLASLAFGISLAVFSLFFLLKDGPVMRRWVDGHLGVSLPTARVITGGVLQSLRRYFGGVTAVAAFNGVVVGLGAWALGVPLAGTIAVVTFVTAYIPFIGAVVAGAFAVILALGSSGTSTALIMLVIVILANGLLQNLVQPIAFGATLNLNPFVILVVTIGAGSLFGMVGLVLGAPLTSAIVHISADLQELRGQSPAEARAP